MGEATSDDMWTPFKHLQAAVGQFLSNSQKANVSELEVILRKHKQNFSALLRNPPRNAKSREELKQGITEGVILPGMGHTILSKDLVDESIILSDMYDLNEFIALELLCTAQQQMPNHPGLPRGLVAILLYYDGRKALVAALKDLMQARFGVSWCTDASPDVTHLVTSYTDDLVANGLLDKIIALLQELDVSKEVELLMNNRALGPPKHHRQVLDLFEEIRLQLANSLFNYAAQCGLPRETTLKLINYLGKYKLAAADGGIDDVTLALQLALMYALDLSVLHRHEDGEDIAKNLPIMKDVDYIEVIMDALSGQWECEGLRSLTLFSLGLAIATMRLSLSTVKISEQDEILVDAAIQGKVFDFLHYTLLENEQIFKVEFYFRRLHFILTDFIELMHSKVTELRARADEIARTIQNYQQQGVTPPTNLCRNFETLLLAVGKLYAQDPFKLSLEYWGPSTSSTAHRGMTRSVCLFKFIRLAGDLLPPTLFVPYLTMLAGLSSNPDAARCAFNLLKQGSGTVGTTTVSWDHFFASFSKYYASLRQEQNPGTETIYRLRAMNRNISQQEISGLQSVLEVLIKVAENDEVARTALCEHPSWTPLHTLLGLVSCSVVIPLKADLVLALAALGRSKETALPLWNNLEASQIIQTIPTTTAFGKRGIAAEIEEVETRNEIYPLTQAILELLHNLSTAVIPKNLGAGSRKPGLDPYVTFIIDTIFLRFYNRNYKNPVEKWVIASKTLKILDMYAKLYEPHPADFPVNGQTKEENPPPGFHVLLQMNTKSDFLRLVLLIINEAATMFDNYAPFATKKQLEQTSLYCLSLIERVLRSFDAFSEAHFAANCSILVCGLNKLLMGVNPRTGKPDHLLNVVKFVTFNSWLPQHALLALKILTAMIRVPNACNHMLSTFTQNEKLVVEIRHGFVECLENDVIDTEQEVNLKEAVLNLLQEALPHSKPNLALYLLGFELNKVDKLMEFPSTCTKSLISLLDLALDVSRKGIQISTDQQRLIEKAYGLLYSLCFDPQTSSTILRFLRSCNDFLSRHISGLPFTDANSSHVLNQMSNLLKCVAIELKQLVENSQLNQFKNMSEILLAVVQSSLNHSDTAPLELSHFHTSMMASNTILETPSSKKKITVPERLLSRLLDCIDIEIKAVDRPRWDCFDNNALIALIKYCEVARPGETRLIDLKKLHDVVREEINAASSVVSGNYSQVMAELDLILDYALQVNAQRNLATATVRFLDAWGQATEILFSVAPNFVLPHYAKQQLIVEILQVLLNKLVSGEMSTDLANVTSSTILVLFVNLRNCYLGKTATDTNESLNVSQLLTLNGTHTATMVSPKTNTLSLKFILKNILDWIIVSGMSSQRLRMNLYASLLHFIHIVRADGDDDAPAEEDDHYVSRLDRSVMRGTTTNSDQTDMTIEVFLSFGDKLIEILCQDCIGGHDVCKMLALSCINALLDLDTMSNFVQFIARRGYLSNLIDSLVKIDGQLCRVLETKPDTLKALYVYESMMAMFCRIVSTHIGAELFLEQNGLNTLSAMRVFNLHPDFQASSYNLMADNAFIPPVEMRYQQILHPALNLCDVIVTTLDTENESAVRHVVYFLLSHSEIVEVVLRAGTPFMSLGLLQELSAITNLIARTTNQALARKIDAQVNQDVGAHLFRLQKLMLTLFPRFLITEKLLKEIQKKKYPANEKERSAHIKFVLQVAANLSMYARNCIVKSEADQRSINVLFSPSINESITDTDLNNGNLQSSPNLGIVVSQLRSCVDYYNKEKLTLDSLQRQKSSLPSLNLDQTVQHQLNLFAERIAEKQNELKLSVFIVENSLYLLWAHLDFYMLKAVGFTHHHYGNESLLASEPGGFPQGWKVNSDDVSALKKALVSVITEAFCKQLVNTAQEQAATDRGFLEALLRRIKRLIQFVPVN